MKMVCGHICFHRIYTWNSVPVYGCWAKLHGLWSLWLQDAIDLFLGNYVVEESEDVTKPCPLRQEKDWKYYAVSGFLCIVAVLDMSQAFTGSHLFLQLPAIFLVAFSMCVISILIPDGKYSCVWVPWYFFGARGRNWVKITWWGKHKWRNLILELLGLHWEIFWTMHKMMFFFLMYCCRACEWAGDVCPLLGRLQCHHTGHDVLLWWGIRRSSKARPV